jgi:hypothetical protein
VKRQLAMKCPGASLLVFLLLSGLFPGPVQAADRSQELIAGLPRAEALRLGERMYREGILPSGAPLKAIVKGDVPVAGEAFTCAHCHQKSGFGSFEGTVKTPPIHAAQLNAAISKFKGIPIRQPLKPGDEEGIFRPAYTDETLGRAIRTGVDAGGRQMNDAMPIYDLDDRDLAILVYYLRNLSAGNEPGVTDETIRFATIVTSEVSTQDRDAMVAPLRDFLENWRIPVRTERMARAEIFVQEGEFREPRTLALSVWVLAGPPDTWKGQLKDHYRKEPVFAILGGMSTGDWAPIHEFCEENRIPAFFPLTDFPVINGHGMYTFYLSKGLYQEGETAARFLNGRRELLQGRQVVQVFRRNRAGLILSRAFADTWAGLGHPVPPEKTIPDGRKFDASFWKDLARSYPHAAVLVWLNSADFPALDTLAAKGALPELVMASGSLLGASVYTLAEKQREAVYLTYPYALPQESRSYRENIEAGIRSDGIPAPNLDIYFKMYPLFTVLNYPLTRIRTFVYRDYFVELVEATPDLVAPAMYPRLSFGSGQRYASKGCYVVQLGPGPKPELVKRSEWIIY